MKRCSLSIMLLVVLLVPRSLTAQEVWSAAASLGASQQVEFVIGEDFMQQSPSVSLGFLASNYFVGLSNEQLILDNLPVVVRFDHRLQQATIYAAGIARCRQLVYHVYDTKGILHMHNSIGCTPHTFSYASLPAGIYILRISGMEGYNPYVTRWIKKDLP